MTQAKSGIMLTNAVLPYLRISSAVTGGVVLEGREECVRKEEALAMEARREGGKCVSASEKCFRILTISSRRPSCQRQLSASAVATHYRSGSGM